MRVSLSLWEPYERVMFFVCIRRLLPFVTGRSRSIAVAGERQKPAKNGHSMWAIFALNLVPEAIHKTSASNPSMIA